MYLKRLEIQGFKSFATKTVLDFLPPKNGVHSITAIVGPNGSGKSNITDAIRWVMGEQSMKNLRGKKSEDIIFSGSETKGAMSAAEVTMVLDNTSPAVETMHASSLRELADFPEINVTRRLYRSGESEYLVNNNPTRLLDIHLLLAKAKFAQHAYSIISQGMIDRLLTVGPTERKDFFDEACGIKEHQIKEHQAELKLARTEENMRQAETLLAEVEPRLKLLSKQVKKLEKRHEIEEELIENQEVYYCTIYSKNKAEYDAFKIQLQKIDTDYRAAFAALEHIQTELAELARGATRQEVFEKLQTTYQQAAKDKNELERQLAIIEGHMRAEYSQAGRQNVGWLENKIAELKNSHSQLAQRLVLVRNEAEKGERDAREQKKKVENLSIDQTQLKLKISRLQNQLLKDQSEQTYREFSGLTAVKAVLEARNRFGKVHGLVAELGEVADEYRLALEVAAGNNLTSIVVENEQVARRAIEYLRENRFGVATFLPLNKIQPRGTYGDVDQLLGESGVIGKAIDLVRYNDTFSNIFSFIFGTTLVVENLKVAERIGIGAAFAAASAGKRVRMVTLDGDLVEQNGSMRGGFRNRANSVGFSTRLSFNNDDHLSEIQAQVNLETHNLTELERNLEQAKTKHLELQVQAQSEAAKVAILETEAESSERELASLEHELRLIQASPKEYGEQLRRLAKEKETLAKTITEKSVSVEKIEREIENFNKKEEEKKQRVFRLQEEMQIKQTEVNGIVAKRNELNIELAKLETKQEDLAKEVEQDMRVSIDSIIKRLAGSDVETQFIASLPNAPLQQLADTIQKLKYQLSLIGGIDEEVVEEYKTTKERYDFLTSQLTDLRQATDDLNAMIAELSDLMKKKRAAAFKKIRKEFGRYFTILFGGGSADLEEIYGEIDEPEDGLAVETPGSGVSGSGNLAAKTPQRGVSTDDDAEPPKKRKEKILTGIEVIANPPGKKVKYLNMLSGGERTLTSIALICAILYHNPSPFVVLDEVEAALDEANTLRFAKIMAELATHSQFIIVTHNRVTMHAAHALYGVTMGGDGVSKLLSVKMEDTPRYEEPMAKSK